MVKRCLLFCLVMLLGSGCQATGEGEVVGSQRHDFRVVTLVQGLEHPWSLAFLPDGRWLVTERPGRLRIIDKGRLLPEPVAGLPPIQAHGQGGLLDVALHPDYARNGWLYLSYAAPGGPGEGTEVLRARLRGNRLTDVQSIFRMTPKVDAPVHFGGRLVFDRAGFLYITLGDRGRKEGAQDLGNHLGTVIRLHDDGRVPRDNPFVNRPGARPEIYSYGHRNVQGAALHPSTGRVWTHEHGPQGGDEINVLKPGVNHGWPVITYGVNYVIGTRIGEGTHKPGMAQPLYQWTPSIAPSGMAFYQGTAFPHWRGNLLVGALKYRMLVRLTLDGERVVAEERLLQDADRIRDVRVGPDGLIYLLTDDADGRLMRLDPVLH
ncbi:MAG: PQQ-dependent sugar dehydrogenase [Pseudomonadota bacterium]